MRDPAVEAALIEWPQPAARRSVEGGEASAVGKLFRPTRDGLSTSGFSEGRRCDFVAATLAREGRIGRPAQRRIADGEIVYGIAVVAP